MAVTEKDFRELIALTAENSQAIKGITEHISRVEVTVEKNSSNITWLYRFGIGVLFTSFVSFGGTYIMHIMNERAEKQSVKKERVADRKTLSAAVMYNY